jgi:hypothetical protein
MSLNTEEKEKKSLPARISMSLAQSLFSRKDTVFNNTLKAVVGFGVGQFHKYAGYMKDDIIDADIGFSAEELNRYQYGNEKPDEKK